MTVRADTGAAALVAALVALVYLAPEYIAQRAGLSQAAVEYVVYGFEACVLCIGLLILCLFIGADGVAAVMIWPAWEAGMRAAARAAFPLDRPPPRLLPNQTLGELAFGRWTSSADLCLAALILLYLLARGRQWPIR